MIDIAKYFGLAWAAASGALGLLTNYRDKETGKITRWGKVALIGIAASAMLSLVAQTADVILKRRHNESEVHRLAVEVKRQEETLGGVQTVLAGVQTVLASVQTVLQQIERQNSLIDGMTVSIEVEFGEDEYIAKPWMQNLRPRLSRLIDTYAKSGHAESTQLEVTSGSRPLTGGTWSADRIRISNGSYAPQYFFDLQLIVAIFDPSRKDLIVGISDIDPDRGPDLQFQLHAKRATAPNVEYLPKEHRIVLEFSEQPVALRSSGKTISMADIGGRRVAVLPMGDAPDSINVRRLAFTTKIGQKVGIVEFEKIGRSFFALIPPVK